MGTYRYSLPKVLLDYSPFFIVPLAGLVAVIYYSGGPFDSLALYATVVCIFFLLPAMTVFIRTNVKILIDEHEIVVKYLLSQEKINWGDITEIERVHELSVWRRENPRDLKFTRNDGKVIFIYGYLKDYDQAIKDIERYSPKAIGQLKAYKGTESVVHKKHEWSLVVIAGALFIWALTIKDIYKDLFSFSNVIIFFIFLFYWVYFLKMGKVIISFSDKGIIYEGGESRGIIFFKRVRSVIPWETINSVKIVNDRKGPIKIETSSRNYLFWSAKDPKINATVFEEINRRMQKTH